MDHYSKRIEAWAGVGMCLSFATAVLLLANTTAPSGPNFHVSGQLPGQVTAD